MVLKHTAVLTLSQQLRDQFTLEDLLDMIDPARNTLWSRFKVAMKANKPSKKGKRIVAIGKLAYMSVEGTFGVPLDLLVEKSGIETALGVGRVTVRIPAFVNNALGAMRLMGMRRFDC